MITAWLAPLPIVLLAIFLQDRYTFGTPLAFFIVFGWMGAFLFFNLRWRAWPCPSCGRPFVNIWTISQRDCPHCHLPFWASSGEKAPA